MSKGFKIAFADESSKMGDAEWRKVTDYYRSEWADFQAKGSALVPIVDEFLHHRPVAVLDVGCGAGQELSAFSTDLSVGVDVNRDGILEGKRFYGDSGPAFSLASGESLPFADESFDLVLCRIALPYMDNAQAMAEMSRVLKPGGVLVVKFHHLRFYLRQLKRAVFSANLRAFLHACRVIACGSWYALTGQQPKIRVGGKVFQEVFQMGRGMRRLIRASGLTPVGLFDRNQPTPTIAAKK